jgi:hypothetical protein
MPDSLLWGLTIALLITTGLLTLLVIGLLRSYGELVRILHDAGIKVNRDETPQQTLPVSSSTLAAPGTSAPGIAGDTLGGGARVVATSGSEDHLLVAFLSSGCGSCVPFWRELRANQGQLPDLDAEVVVVTKGVEREEPSKLKELAGGEVQVIMSDESWSAFDVPLTPHFALIDRSRGVIIGEGSSADPNALADLMRRAAADARSVTRREFLTGSSGGDTS